MDKIPPQNALKLLRDDFAFSASFALMALDAGLAAAEGTDHTFARGSLALSDDGVFLGNIDVTVDLAEIDTAEAVRSDLRANRVQFRLRGADAKTSVIVGYTDGLEVLRIALDADGELYVTVAPAAVIEF